MPEQIKIMFQTLHDGMSFRLAQVFYLSGSFIGGICIAIAQDGLFALICLIYFILWVVVLGMISGKMKRNQFNKLSLSKKLTAMIDENISAVKEIMAFTSEEFHEQKFEQLCEEDKQVGLRAAKTLASREAMLRVLLFGFFFYAYAIGGAFIGNHFTNPT